VDLWLDASSGGSPSLWCPLGAEIGDLEAESAAADRDSAL